MPSNPIALAWRPHAAAYTWVADRLRADADFRRVVKTFVSRVPGTSQDDNPPTPALCPWVRLTPTPEAQFPFCTLGDRVVSESAMAIQVEAAVAGFAPIDAMALWDLVWQILLGDRYTPATVVSHRQAYINHYSLDQPFAIEQAQPDSGSGLVYGAGTIRLYLRG